MAFLQAEINRSKTDTVPPVRVRVRVRVRGAWPGVRVRFRARSARARALAHALGLIRLNTAILAVRRVGLYLARPRACVDSGGYSAQLPERVAGGRGGELCVSGASRNRGGWRGGLTGAARLDAER